MSPDEAWDAFKLSHGDQDARNVLLIHYRPLAVRISRKMWRNVPPSVDADDLESCAVEGLIRALEHYRPDDNPNFESYAIRSIQSKILDYLRELDWAPRSLRKAARDIEKATTALERRHERTPLPEEVAAELGLPTERVTAVLSQVDRAKGRSLDERTDEGASKYESVEDVLSPQPEDVSAASESCSILTRFLASLDTQHRLILTLYYYEEMTLAQVGEILGLPESRVSSMHTATMLSLRERLISHLRAA